MKMGNFIKKMYNFAAHTHPKIAMRECCAVQQGATMNLISANISYYKMQLIQFIRAHTCVLTKNIFLINLKKKRKKEIKKDKSEKKNLLNFF